MRLIGVREDYRRYDREAHAGGNLLPLQREYADLQPQLEIAQRTHDSLRSCVLGFGDLTSMLNENRETPQYLPDKPIRPCRSLRMLSLAPIPLRYLFRQLKYPNRQYRLQFSDSPVAVVDGEARCGGRSWDGTKFFAADLTSPPLQDTQLYDEMRFETGSLGEQIEMARHQEPTSRELRSPVAGEFSLVRDELYLRLTVNGYDVFRFDLLDADSVSAIDSPSRVAVGDVVGRLTRSVGYLAAQFVGGKPECCMIGRGVMPASRRHTQLRFALRSMREILSYRPSSITLEESLPRFLLQFSEDTLRSKRNPPVNWTANPTFRQQLLWAISPDAIGHETGLFVRSPVTGLFVSEDRSACYRHLVFRSDDGQNYPLSLPACAELDVRPGDKGVPVTRGQVLGDYVARAYYSTYDELSRVADGSMTKIEDTYFEQLLLRPGQCGWDGLGLCLDARFAGESLVDFSLGAWLDFSALSHLFDRDLGMYVTPPLPLDVYQMGLEYRVNGVTYELSPLLPETHSGPQQGDRQKRRRNRRRRRERSQDQANTST